MADLIVQPLKASGEISTDSMIAVLAKAFEAKGATVAETIRIAGLDIKPGVTSDEGDGDRCPEVREKIMAADILILGTPIWIGSAGSVAKRVTERMDAFLEETDEQGRMPSYGKVAVAAIVGNEDGAHFASAQIFQALNDVGWTIPPSPPATVSARRWGRPTSRISARRRRWSRRPPRWPHPTPRTSQAC